MFWALVFGSIVFLVGYNIYPPVGGVCGYLVVALLMYRKGEDAFVCGMISGFIGFIVTLAHLETGFIVGLMVFLIIVRVGDEEEEKVVKQHKAQEVMNSTG